MTNPTQPTPNFDPITTMFRHNAWANAQLFDLCASLSEAQLATHITGTYGSIRDTLEHIANAERSYLHRINTGEPYRRAKDAPPLTMSEMRESIRASGEGFVATAPRVTAADSVTVDWDGAPRAVPCALLLTQAINHATEHRAQIMTTLTSIGVQPPDLDGWTFFETHG